MKRVIYTLGFSEISLRDIARLGGKNAGLGQLFNALRPAGVSVLSGFATTADAYRRLPLEHDLEYKLSSLLSDFNPEEP